MLLKNKIALAFTSDADVIHEVDSLSPLLAISILLNNVQLVLSGVAVVSGSQTKIAYVNLGCYYIIGLHLGFLTGWVLKLGIKGIWCGMILGGTFTQTVTLATITINLTGIKS
ncbi:hypothetical protein D5086_022442 [Populus alba]|uniref:Uncharacterized protein n=1 Tax=Populus alba TaxID=43335 RepID=A0ACC4BFD2_POPAL